MTATAWARLDVDPWDYKPPRPPIDDITIPLHLGGFIAFTRALIGEAVPLGRDNEPSAVWIARTQAELSTAASREFGRPCKIKLSWERPFLAHKSFQVDEDFK